MNLLEFNQRAIENDELIARLRRELADALAAREELFRTEVQDGEEVSAQTTSHVGG
jgi:hypothetical protein